MLYLYSDVFLIAIIYTGSWKQVGTKPIKIEAEEEDKPPTTSAVLQENQYKVLVRYVRVILFYHVHAAVQYKGSTT